MIDKSTVFCRWPIYGIFLIDNDLQDTYHKHRLLIQIYRLRGAHRHFARGCKIFDAREARRNFLSCTPCKIRAPPVISFLQPLWFFSCTPSFILMAPPKFFFRPSHFRTRPSLPRRLCQKLSLMFHVCISDFPDTLLYSIELKI